MRYVLLVIVLGYGATYGLKAVGSYNLYVDHYGQPYKPKYFVPDPEVPYFDENHNVLSFEEAFDREMARYKEEQQP